MTEPRLLSEQFVAIPGRAMPGRLLLNRGPATPRLGGLQSELARIWAAITVLQAQLRQIVIARAATTTRQRLANRLVALYGPNRPSCTTKAILKVLREEPNSEPFDDRTFYRALKLLHWSSSEDH